jgi:RimJ/RimL family protein N-acetyltransferase
VLVCDLQRWAGALSMILDGTYAVRARSRYYRLAQLKAEDWQERIPNGFSMERMEASLLGHGLEGADGMVEGILEEWNSLDAFLERGFGCYMVDGTRVVSWSFADYVSGERCEIGIYTDGDYRRRGFGTLTAAATAAQAVARGLSSIDWHCWDNNVGSIRVAENVGFVKAGAYDVFINHWPALNVSDMAQAEFRAFAQWYEREFEARPPSSGFPHVVAAKAWALSGDRAGCFRHLHNAVDVGWLRSVEQLRLIWPELWFNPHLEAMEEWQGLAKRLEPGRTPPGGGETSLGPQVPATQRGA